jgi:hypothetical protein
MNDTEDTLYAERTNSCHMPVYFYGGPWSTWATITTDWKTDIEYKPRPREWRCPYCGSPQKEERTHCEKCGGPRDYLLN